MSFKECRMVKCRANTKTKVTVEDFDELKKLFLLDIRNIVQIDEVPAQLIFNWDQTGINYVPASNWTMEQVGSNRIVIIGKDDKRQLTAVFGCSMAGEFLPPQLVYQGKTNRCLPQYKFPAGWDIRTVGTMRKPLVGISLTSFYLIWTKLKRN